MNSVDPVVPRTLACSDGTYFISGGRQPGAKRLLRANHRARLKTEARAILNRVVAVIEHAIETFVQVRDVVTAVEIIIDKYFPVALDDVRSSLKPVKIPETKRTYLIE